MIISSLLDNDFYKFSMGQIVFHQFNDFDVKYKFKCRNKGVVFSIKDLDEIEEEVKHFCTLKFTPDELNYLKSIKVLKSSFVEFLSLYRPDIEHFKINLNIDGSLDITIEGPWFLTIYWEVPILAIVNEVYMRNTYKLTTEDTEQFFINLNNKLQIARDSNFKFCDFGTRRRFSRETQECVVEICTKYCKGNFTGTSNVKLAMDNKISYIGTFAHEFICAGQACEDVTLAGSQKHMLQKWVDEYRGDLGIALSDTLGFDKFLKDFDPYFSKLYDGVRHDSGDPFDWARRMIDHYKKYNIDPKTKTFVFSDGLNFNKCSELQKAFGEQIKIVFGVGTNLTNDFEGVDPLQIVIKMVEANKRPVAKISDSPGKLMCEDQEFISYLKSVI